ncbi:hypothetical protein AK812_SmicGene42599 [Symbiodinium microadriaticum]|uniref:Uncharacterized protein n=1 Tax=Symbiodinium microadriaticum TaxID=2951 RepID=A0A1Q9C359_SYMMI|nr:hypothetical protein AK812_SmicGene42599 [Symbiodinium microadriaticum]
MAPVPDSYTAQALLAHRWGRLSSHDASSSSDFPSRIEASRRLTMSHERWAARSALQELQAETLNASETARYARNSAYVRLFLICICFAEIVILVPNILTEVAIDRGLYAPILRTVLSVVRLSPLMWPLLGKMGRWGAALRHLVEVALPTIYGPACGGVEPCRGFATALSGWYLISTPMHDAFSPTTEADLAPKELQPPGQAPGPAVPCYFSSDNLAVQLAYPRAETCYTIYTLELEA